ncbi:MAG: Ig-like domain-containing protein [Clostridia bacterium]|nr:Ig-like domain-containing protein [Clostridia bacterium]
MKKLSILLVFVLLLGCLFLVACGGTGDNGDDTGDGGQTGGGEQTGGSEQGGEVDNGYTIIVKDQFGNAMTGVNLQICHGDLSLGNCLKPKDVDENGKAFYSYSGTLENARVQINSVPENVEKPTDYIFFENDSKTLEITLRRVVKITVNAVDKAGNKLAYISVSAYKVGNGLGGLVEAKETNSEGVCEFVLDSGLYSLIFEPKNLAFKLTNGNSEGDSSTYTLKEGENSFTAIFEESTEAISYTITVKDADGNPLQGVTVSFYSMDYTKLYSPITDENGQVTASLANGDYLASAEVDSTKNAQVYIFEKNNTCKGEISVYNTQAGGFKFNAIMILGQSEFTVEAGKTQWICVYNPNGETVSFVNNEGLTITGDGEFSDNTFTFSEIDGNKGYIKVENNSEGAITYTAIIDSALVPTPYGE